MIFDTNTVWKKMLSRGKKKSFIRIGVRDGGTPESRIKGATVVDITHLYSAANLPSDHKTFVTDCYRTGREYALTLQLRTTPRYDLKRKPYRGDAENFNFASWCRPIDMILVKQVSRTIYFFIRTSYKSLRRSLRLRTLP